MASFIPNLGGPGWIKDIVDITLSLDDSPILVKDNGSTFTIPVEAYTGQAPLFNSNSTIRGKVTVTAPPDAKIYTREINIRLSEYVTFVDPYVTNELQDASTERNISDAERYIEGSEEFPFEVSQIHCASVRLGETFSTSVFPLTLLTVD